MVNSHLSYHSLLSASPSSELRNSQAVKRKHDDFNSAMWKLKRDIAANEFYTVWKETLLPTKRIFGTVAEMWVIFFVVLQR